MTIREVFLCLSAFVRVATFDKTTSELASCFATAHSCGLRLMQLCHMIPLPVFATAHSCGLRRSYLQFIQDIPSLPQRIRAGCDDRKEVDHSGNRLCHSAFVRVATIPQNKRPPPSRPLPQRIRAGCDVDVRGTVFIGADLCHSAFVRVATAEKQCSALRICCEKVDSFSSVGESGLALTIFPFSFAAKATYVAINDSFGRAIDRFFWCEPHRN